MTTTIRGELQIDHDRGVIYFHNEVTGCTILRIGHLPRPIMDIYASRNEHLLDIIHMHGCNWKGEDVERLRSNETNS